MGDMASERPLILGIESATARVGCAIGSADGVLAARESAQPRRHAESLVPQIAEVIEESGATVADIGVIAVDIGPGLYTGLRVGITSAVTMAYALGAAMVPTTSLSLVARAAWGVRTVHATNTASLGNATSPARHERIDVVVDARRGELFHAAFTSSFDCISEPSVLVAEELVDRLAREAVTTHIVGDGVETYPELFAQAGFNVEPNVVYPSAETIVSVAAQAIAAGKTVSPESIKPLYLRGPDAQPIKAGS